VVPDVFVRAQLKSGAVLDEYELMTLIGQGGSSYIYLAKHEKLRRQVAIKVLLPELSGDVGYVDRFVREARLIARFQHPNIVPVFDYGTCSGWTYLVMPYLSGGTLVDRILRQSPEDDQAGNVSSVAFILSQLSRALDYAHAAGVVHCDVKPANILFDAQGVPLLADFGIAITPDSGTAIRDRAEFLAGSVSYMSPEVWRGDVLTPAADQYALGLVIYTLLAGHPPFGSEALSPVDMMYRHLNDMPIPVHFLRDEISEAVSAVISRAIAKSASDRFPSVGAFAEAFDQAVRSTVSLKDADILSNNSDRSPASAVPAWAGAPTRVSRRAPMRVSRTSLVEDSAPVVKVFISYRRSDSSSMTGRIYDELRTQFGAEAIFLDINSIPLGTNFKRYLERVIRKAMVVLVIIGPEWLTVVDESGKRRLDNPDDFVRVEIEAAINLDVPLIPVLIEGASMPKAADLPLSLAELVYCNGLAVRSEPDFHYDMSRLIGSLSYLL